MDFLTMDFPLKDPKSNINLTTNVNYTRSVNTITSVNRSNNTLSGASDPSFTNNYVLRTNSTVYNEFKRTFGS